MRLLLVEDEVDIQRFLLRSLEEAGYEPHAHGGTVATSNEQSGGAQIIITLPLQSERNFQTVALATTAWR
jgi:DNA-binding response OmpR family regulator